MTAAAADGSDTQQEQQPPPPSKGSGLALFFRDFLPGDAATNYSTSLSEINNDENIVHNPSPPPIHYTYKQWRDEQKRQLMEFLAKRMTLGGDKEDEISSEDEEDEQPIQQSQQPETQPLFQTQEFHAVDADNHHRPRKKRRRRKAVPHLSDAIHQVSKLEFLDLYTQSLNVSLCRVIKVWKLRDTKRGAFAPLAETARSSYNNLEDDGPIAPAYRSVLSMEVEQVVVGAENSATRQRIKLFFYNDYGERTAQWMEKRKKNQQFFLNLADVPAECIFPRANTNSWLDKQNMVEFCICLGDESSAKVVQDGKFIRFDDDQVQVTMAPQSALETASGDDVLVLSRKEDDFLSAGSEGSSQKNLAAASMERLRSEWANFRKSHRPNGEPIQGTTTTTTAAAAATQTLLTDDDEPFTLEPMTVVGTATQKPYEGPKNYIQLGDLESRRDEYKQQGTLKSRSFNIYAVILSFTASALCNSGDSMVAATLVDPSCTTPITVTMYFDKRKGLLPNFARMGDVVRVHRCEIDDQKSDLHLRSRSRQSGSCLVTRKTEQGEWVIFPTALHTFSFDPAEAERTQKLWLWGQKFIKKFPTLKQQHLFSLAELNSINDSDEEHLKDRDITVMVTGIFPYPPERFGAVPRGFLRVWDGTGIAPSDPYPVQTIATQHAAGRGDPPPEALTRMVKTVKDMQATDASMQPPLSFCGRVANAVVWEDKMFDLIKHHVSVGAFVRLRNVAIARHADNPFRSLIVYRHTWLTPLPDQNFEVQALLKAHNQRVIRREYNPGAGLLPSNLNHGASRLKEFVDDEALGVFTGPVYVKVVPENTTHEEMKQKLDDANKKVPILFVVKDQSGSLTAVASETFREKMRDIVKDAATWKNLLLPDRTFTATVRSVDWDNHRYFVLNDLT